MNVSELIKKLTELSERYGDLPVENEYGHSIDPPDFNDDDGSCILISFSN